MTRGEGVTNYRRPADSVAKRLLDIIVAASGLLATIPLMLLVACAIRIDSQGPVLFLQSRAGLDGKAFRMMKFRTMVAGAEGLRQSLLSANEAPFPAFKMSADPRVTRVGTMLRRSSLDELPQLWNVLIGDMSIVGPRPLPTFESEALTPYQRARLMAKPGITGVWQLEHRHADRGQSFDDWARADLTYIQQWSLGLDVQLILRTIPAVLRLTGR